MSRWARAGVTWLLMACAPPTSTPTAAPAPAAAQVEIVDPRTRLLRVYDEAGFPDVSGRRLVERRIHLSRGLPSCTRGVLLQRGHANIFLSGDLSIDYGSVLIDAIPHALRRATPREPRFVGVHLHESSTKHIVDAPLPESLLGQPGLGLRVEGSPRVCDPPELSPELDMVVRSRWAEMRGRPDLLDPSLLDLLADEEIEHTLRTELAAMLYEQAVASMQAWLPRQEVAQLLRRAARVTPSREHARMWLVDARRLEDSTALRGESEPDAIATLLAEQSMQPLHELDLDVRGAGWDAAAYLRDPIGELTELGMPGAQQLVAHASDERWTRTLCRDRPCTVGELVREGLVLFAGRGFEDAAQVHAWWDEVEGMTEADMARASFDTPWFQEAAFRLFDIEGPGIVDELVAELDRHAPDEVAAALWDALRIADDRVLDDRELSRRYARAFVRVLDATDNGWSPAAFRGLLEVDPDAALDRIVRPFDRVLPERGAAGAARSWTVWTVAFIQTMRRGHRPMHARLLRALALPPDHALRSSAMKAVDHVCVSLRACPASIRKAAIRSLRRALQEAHPRYELADRATLAGLTEAADAVQGPARITSARARRGASGSPRASRRGG